MHATKLKGNDVFISFIFYRLLSLEVVASQMTISKRCDMPSCVLFVVVAGACVRACVRACVCVCVLGNHLYVFALRME